MANGFIVAVKGNQRSRYQDHAAFHVGEDREIWMIADGATNARDSGPFVSLFCQSLLQQLILTGDDLSVSQVSAALGTVHREIRRNFICAKGSFLMLVIERKSGVQHCFFLGDCRIGNVQNHRVIWHIQPHSLAALYESTDEQRLCAHPSRHVLFRQLKARRFEQPGYLRLHLDLSLPVILATDGFWCNYPALLPAELSAEALDNHLRTLENQTDDRTVVVRHHLRNGVLLSQNAKQEQPSAPQKALSSDTGTVERRATSCEWL